MTCYAEKRNGRLTGVWIAEASVLVMGKRTRIRERFDTKSLGDKWAATCEAMGERLPRADKSGQRAITFRQVAQELKEAGGPRGSWARERDKSVIQRLDHAMSSRLGPLPITDIRYAEAEAYVQLLSRKPGKSGGRLSNHTINRYLTAISAVLSYAERKEYLPRAPQLPWRDAPRKKRYGYAPSQEEAVIRALEALGRPIEALCFRVLSVSGLRAGELLGLTAEQVDAEHFINLDDPELVKNGETRSVYIGEQLATSLRAVITDGLMPKYSTLHKYVTVALESAGLEIPRPLHSLRHTAATRTINSGLDLQVAQQLLGHKSIRTTIGYRHVSREALRERAKNLPLRAGLDEDLSQKATQEVPDNVD